MFSVCGQQLAGVLADEAKQETDEQKNTKKKTRKTREYENFARNGSKETDKLDASLLVSDTDHVKEFNESTSASVNVQLLT